jgi:CBS domain-containing protein
MQVCTILDAKGRDVATIAPAATLADAVAALRDHGVGALVVTDADGGVAGIISERDVVRAVAAHGMGSLGRTVGSAMTTAVRTCTDQDLIEALMHTMTQGRFRHMPVLDDAGRLAGIVSIGDVVKYRLHQLEGENQTLFDYISAR